MNTQDTVAFALSEINASFSDPGLTLVVLARKCRRSPWHLSRTLSRFDGLGFATRLHLIRTSEARRLLSTSQLTVKEIAAAVGYSSAKHLCRHFRRRFSVTPSEARALACQVSSDQSLLACARTDPI